MVDLDCPRGLTVMCKTYRNHQAVSYHIKNLKRQHLIRLPDVITVHNVMNFISKITIYLLINQPFVNKTKTRS